MRRILRKTSGLAAVFCLLLSCSGNKNESGNTQSAGKDTVTAKTPEGMSLSSTAFESGKPIPKKYTCDAEDISPPLRWKNIPAQTQSLALICDDPDAPGGTWVHWVVFNISPKITEIPENFTRKQTAENGIQQGMNDFKKTGYGGPCPPSGTHHYSFRLYALDCAISSEKPLTKNELERLMKDRILGKAELIGTYSH